MGRGSSLWAVKKKKRWGYQRFFILTRTVGAARLMLSKNVQFFDRQ
jgi:hypothetical protein